MRLVPLLLCVVCTVATAEDRTDKVRSLMEAQGLLASFEQTLRTAREATKANAEKMLKRLLDELNPSPAFRERLQAAGEEYIEAARHPWGPKDYVEAWSELYAPEFTDDELDELLRYYRSPLGQKAMAVSRAAEVQFLDKLREKHRPVMEKATAEYLQKIKQIVTECSCPR